MAELGGKEMGDTAVHRNLGAEAKRVGAAIAEEAGDTFIDWRSLAPRYQWQRIVQMVIDAPLEARRALLDALGHSPDCVTPDHYRKVWQEEREARERAEADRHPGCTCPSTGDAPAMHHDYCAAHYGGQHHYDCVPRAESGRDLWKRIANETSADLDRLFRAIQRHREDMRGIAKEGAGRWTAHINEANRRLWAALSADADADAEPDHTDPACVIPHPHPGRSCDRRSMLDCEPGCDLPGGHDGPCEPYRAESEPNPFRCQRCTVPIAYTGAYGDLETHVAPGLDPSRNREAVEANADHDPLPETRDAEGGRPREADPQGDSPSTDASVDGGGDECDCDTAQYDGEHSRYCPAGDGGRSPAINAVFEATSLRLEQCVDAIDTALASGHVRLTDPGEPDISVEAYWAVSEERDKAEARVHELETALREIANKGVMAPGMSNQEEMIRVARAALAGGSDA